jgi:hypothetical protein
MVLVTLDEPLCWSMKLTLWLKMIQMVMALGSSCCSSFHA